MFTYCCKEKDEDKNENKIIKHKLKHSNSEPTINLKSKPIYMNSPSNMSDSFYIGRPYRRKKSRI